MSNRTSLAFEAIETAGVDDAEAIARLINAAYVVEAPFIDGQRTTSKEVRRLIEHDTMLVVRSDGIEPVACVHVLVDGERGYFGMLSVSPARQGSGLGRRLIAETETRLKQAGCRFVELQVVHRRTPLLPWYEAMGYRQTGTADFPEPAKLKAPTHMVQLRKDLAGRAHD